MRATLNKRRGSPRAVMTFVLSAVLGCGSGLGCSDSAGGRDLGLTAVEPDVGTARGGDEVVLTGRGFDEGARVFFGDQECAEVEPVSSEELRVVTPVALAGTVDVSVRNPDGGEVLAEGAFTFEPLRLRFQEAAAHYLPDLGGIVVNDAAAADVNGDGNVDVVVAVSGDESRILYGNGAGTFTDPYGAGDATDLLTPRWRNDVRRVVVADFDLDGSPDVFACNGGGATNRLLVNQGGDHLSDETRQALPLNRDACVMATPVDLNDDGLLDLAWVGVDRGSQERHLRVLWNRFDGGELTFESAAALEAPQSIDGQEHSAMWGSAPEVQGLYTFSVVEAWAGRMSGSVDYDFSAAAAGGRLMTLHSGVGIPEAPTALELELFGDGSGHALYVELRDAGGESFHKSVMPVEWNGWTHVRVDDPESWEFDGDGTFDPPVAEVNVGLVAGETGPATGRVVLDDLVLEYEAAGFALVEDYERYEWAHTWPSAVGWLTAADVGADGAADLILSIGDAGASTSLWLLANRTGAADPEPLFFGANALASGGEALSQVAALDVDGDGDLDLVALSRDGQDRLLLGDGQGFFFDDTLRTMPLDRVDGRRMAVADLDRDTLPDLVIANHGAVNRLYLGQPDGTFVDQTPAVPLDEHTSRVVVVLDADRDQDLDFMVFEDTGPRLYVSVEESSLDR